MSYLFAYIAGLLLAIMISLNGLLAEKTSVYFSSFLYNAVGLLVFSIAIAYFHMKKIKNSPIQTHELLSPIKPQSSSQSKPQSSSQSKPQSSSQLSSELTSQPKNFDHFLIIPGVMGAFTIILNSTAITTLGVTLMVAISLLGQVITSLVIDSKGLMGKQKSAITSKQVLGILLMLLGVWLLL